MDKPIIIDSIRNRRIWVNVTANDMVKLKEIVNYLNELENEKPKKEKRKISLDLICYNYLAELIKVYEQYAKIGEQSNNTG